MFLQKKEQQLYNVTMQRKSQEVVFERYNKEIITMMKGTCLYLLKHFKGYLSLIERLISNLQTRKY